MIVAKRFAWRVAFLSFIAIVAIIIVTVMLQGKNDFPPVRGLCTVYFV